MAYLQKGYWCVWNGNGKVREGGAVHYPLHRLIYEEAHGVVLPREIVVHHIDEDPQNNEVSNLEAVTRRDHPSRHRRSVREGERLCGRCSTWKSIQDFSKGQKRCKPCARSAHREWVRDHPERVDEYNRRRREGFAAR